MGWIALAIVASVALIVWRAEIFARQVADRRLSVEERRVALEESVKKAPDKRPVLPPDLEALAQGYNEAWAQDQVRAAIQDEYDARGDWDAVRSAYFGA